MDKAWAHYHNNIEPKYYTLAIWGWSRIVLLKIEQVAQVYINPHPRGRSGSDETRDYARLDSLTLCTRFAVCVCCIEDRRNIEENTTFQTLCFLIKFL